MKISSALFAILIIAGVILFFGMMVNEANTQYGTTINGSAWNGTRYDFSNTLNSGSMMKLKSSFETITNTDTGFFSKIGAGIIAIPYAIILVPSVVLDSLVVMGNISTNLLGDLGIPVAFIVLVVIGVTIWGIFKLVEFFNKAPI